MANTNPARGMRDFLPSDVRKREYVINIIKEVYESYGFEPLETPASFAIVAVAAARPSEAMTRTAAAMMALRLSSLLGLAMLLVPPKG